ncbi:MAG: 16S rRNA (adenine(1518)-N(6)/adenine(1519)-N(6))-dimethyltransferase RsmA [Bacteriovoracaceae bacterium]|nr:16S rRNA (adenine(1518)-N(6)/adenine(1519)-N(6))-dimethyltransferase RsmA [Bacteriovoracaceae bacterium]
MSKLPVANKALGQHFLIDKNIINKITEDFSEYAKAILEVGPGPGILTEGLSQHQLPFHVIDKDERFPTYLKEFLPDECIHIQDALEWDLEAGFKEWHWEDKPIWLVSNLPYNVSTPLLIKFLQAPSLKYMTLMFQREVADKAFPIDTRKGKAMNSLMALCQTYFEVDLLCKVPPGAFSPPPKVDSAVLSFKRIENPIVPLAQFRSFEKFLRHLFQFKRKQMGKILKSNYPIETLEAVFEKLNLTLNLRAEAIELIQIQNLYLSLKETTACSN